MKELKDIIENYEKYRTFLQDRLGARLCDFLTLEQAQKIGFDIKEGKEWPSPKPWNKESILKQLREDVEFGFEKAINQRGISSSLMFEVVRGWNEILEDGLENWPEDNYAQYGLPLFIATAKKYNFPIPEEITPGDTGKEFKYGINEYYIDPYTLPTLYYINDILGLSTVSAREGLYKGKNVKDWNRSDFEPNAYIAWSEKDKDLVMPLLEHIHATIPETYLQIDNKSLWGKVRMIFPVSKNATENDIKDLWEHIYKFCKSYGTNIEKNS